MDSRDKWEQGMDHVPSTHENTILPNSKITQAVQPCLEAASESKRHVVKRSVEDQIMEPATKKMKTECNVIIKLEKTEDVNIEVKPLGDTEHEQMVQMPIPADFKMKVEVESEVEESTSDQESEEPCSSSPDYSGRRYLSVRSDLYGNNRESSDFSSDGSVARIGGYLEEFSSNANSDSNINGNAIDYDLEYVESAREYDILESCILVLLNIASGMHRLNANPRTRKAIMCLISCIVIQLRTARNRRQQRGGRS